MDFVYDRLESIVLTVRCRYRSPSGEYRKRL
jgi:hypothetical protein